MKIPITIAGLLAVSANGQTTHLRQLQEMCGNIAPRCKELGGECTSLEKCKAYYGPDAKYIQHKEFCYSEKGECGCCFKSEKSPLDILGIQVDKASPKGLTTAGDDSSGTKLSIEMGDGIMKNVALLIRDDSGMLWSFNSFVRELTKVSCDGKTCHAVVRGNAHSELVDKLMPPKRQEEITYRALINTEPIPSPQDAVFASEFVPAEMTIKFDDLSEFELVQKLVDSRDFSNSINLQGRLGVSLALIPTAAQKDAGVVSQMIATALDYRTIWRTVPELNIEDIIVYPLFEPKKDICLQPVRTRYRECNWSLFGICFSWGSYVYSGAGLAFGKPGVTEHWAKVDVTFTWRNWITIDDTSGTYQSLTESEMGSLRAEVSVDDCIEIFFVRKFQPSETYGGGACWSGGSANAKIISSDEQVSCGVDQTHLAHEVGHAIGLKHPGAGGNEGNTGTLMCPSGWQRDNPRRNSKSNGDNVANPLFVNYWGTLTVDNHDCIDNGDCGSCNAHIPPDSC